MEGNQMKMRYALETLLNLALVVQDENKDCGPKTKVPEQFIIDVARSALSDSARNCDVGTAEEQKGRFEEFCDDEKGDRQHCRNCSLRNALDCELVWAQMPYEAQEGGAKRMTKSNLSPASSAV